MGQHSSAESLMAGVESDALRVKAAALAVQMNWVLSAPGDEVNWFEIECLAVNGRHNVISDLVEWCRSARDVLEAVGRG